MALSSADRFVVVLTGISPNLNLYTNGLGDLISIYVGGMSYEVVEEAEQTAAIDAQ